jgi:hypothetical protein
MLSDAQWAVLEPLVEACRPKGQDATAGSAAHDLGHSLADFVTRRWTVRYSAR